MLPVKIAGLGWYLPERRVTNADLEAQLGIPADWIERVTGVQERRYATTETTLSMGAAASHIALKEAGLGVEDLDAIISAATGVQQAIPCTAALMQRELNAPDGASACFDVNATCLSFLFALQTAAYLIAAGIYRTVLIVSSEIVSSSLNPLERESAVLFGDAAAAAVVTHAGPGETSALWHSHFETHSSGADLTQILGGGTLHHPNHPTTTPEMNTFHMRGIQVFKQAALLSGPFLDRFLARLEWNRRQIDAVVLHQASRHALEQLHTRLGFTVEQVVMNLTLRGNCVAASIPLTLAEAVHNGRICRGDRVLLAGTGAGLTLGAIAITF
ncbi:MAG TPA: beta-ketoacyl-ACP synthase 3 [Ktedonobacteraceae bacterium]